MHRLLNAIVVICFIYLIAMLLKKKGVLHEENALTLGMVTSPCRPG